MRLKVGDLFTIPLNGEEVGFGQIVARPNKATLIIVVYDLRSKVSESYNLEKVGSSNVLLLGYTLDAKLYHKHWEIIGNNPVKDVEMPIYKVGIPPGDIFITNYKGEVIRSCTVEEFDQLIYLTVIAPVRYENAVKAYFGLQEWIDEDYNKILYKSVLASVKVLK